MTLPRPLIAVIAALAGLLGAGVAAFATSQTAAPVIHACYSKSTGVMRHISATGHCKASEKALKWNVQGIQGVPGTNGADGTNGTNGTDGTNGTNAPGLPTMVLGAGVSAPELFAIPTVDWGPPPAPSHALTLDGSGWDQSPSDVDSVTGGQVVLEWDATNTSVGGCNSNGSESVTVTVQVDGNTIASKTASWSPTDPSLINKTTVNLGTAPDSVLAYLSAPAQVTHHTVTASVSPGHSCTQGGSYGVAALSLEVTRTH